MNNVIGIQTLATLPTEEVHRLVGALRQTRMLNPAFELPSEWSTHPEVEVGELVERLQNHLTRKGYHFLLEAMRMHNRQEPEDLWQITDAQDFLAAIRLALNRQERLNRSEKTTVSVKELLIDIPGEKISNFARDLQQQMHVLYRTLVGSRNGNGWLFSPQVLWTRLQARAKRLQAEAHIERTLSQAAQYTAHMVGSEVEREAVLARVDRLREQLRQQLEVFCQEHGLPIPEPYSREEAYCLHLLSAYFVALAEAEETVAKQASALARRQIALESRQAMANLDSDVLPKLMDTLLQVDPLVEVFLRERVRHRGALIASGLIAALGGVFWGILEGVNDVFIAGIARYAPVVAPPLLLGLITLAVQTMRYGVPKNWEMLLGYLNQAIWNSALALGATLIAYGCWQYFTRRGRNPSRQDRSPVIGSDGGGGSAQATNNLA